MMANVLEIYWAPLIEKPSVKQKQNEANDDVTLIADIFTPLLRLSYSRNTVDNFLDHEIS